MPTKPPVIIEQTSKRYKAMQAVGLLVAMPGALLCGAAGTAELPILAWVSGTVGAIGIVVYGSGRLLAWWHHG